MQAARSRSLWRGLSGLRELEQNCGNLHPFSRILGIQKLGSAHSPENLRPPPTSCAEKRTVPPFFFRILLACSIQPTRSNESNRRDTDDTNTNTNSNNSSPIDERRSGVHH
jgi:hypothetical protein